MTTTFSARIFLFACLVGAAGAAVVAGQDRPRAPFSVYVHATPSKFGFIDRRSKGLDESVKDTRGWIARNKDWFRLVDTPSSADVSVELLSRVTRTEPETIGLLESLLPGASSVRKRRSDRVFLELKAVVRAAGVEKALTGLTSSESPVFGWGEAARSLSAGFEAWVKATDIRPTSEPRRATAVPPGPAPASPAPRRPTVRLKVYCFTGSGSARAGASGSASPSDRADSLKDLQEEMAKRKDWLELVASRESSDLSVEVLDRSVFQWVSRRQSDQLPVGNSVSRMRVMTEYHVRAVMRRGDYDNEMTGVGADLRATWQATAGSVAAEIEQWAKDNHQKLSTTR